LFGADNPTLDAARMQWFHGEEGMQWYFAQDFDASNLYCVQASCPEELAHSMKYVSTSG
jgi:hypothetical protein